MDKTLKIPALLLNSSMSRDFEQVHCHFIRFIQPSINSSILQNSWCPMTQKKRFRTSFKNSKSLSQALRYPYFFYVP